jgi:diadenosine tetraphosphate (Ap4A) HIT family hydrolase
MGGGCPFCRRIAADDVLLANPSAVAFPDAYPVAPGHMLVCPRQHVVHLFDLDEPSWSGLWALVRQVQAHLAERIRADGWSIGVNVGEAAGQTVAHAHVHLIPRRLGDVADPRGGVRWVLPGAADYWTDS